MRAGWLIITLGFLAASAPADDPPKIVPAAESKGHIGEKCTVELTVKASKNAAPRKTYFLDSEPDFRDPKNFTVIISYDDADKFKQAGIDDPAAHYRDKTIRVTGTIIFEDEQTRIHADDPKQIEIIPKP